MKANRLVLPLLLIASAGCGGETPVAPAVTPAASPLPPAAPAVPSPPVALPSADATTDAGASPKLTSRSLPLPGAVAPVSFDYLAADRTNGRIYVPLSNTGSLAVLDVASGKFSHVDGFKTAERERNGKKRTFGPTAVAIGDGVAFVGDRGTDEVCVVDTKAMKISRCVKVPLRIDGVEYVPWAKEVWVTAPDDHSLTILDAAHDLKSKAVVKTDGAPEGYGKDESRGLFFTNLEDKGSTLAIDVKTHTIKSTWNPGCGSDGPRGLAVDAARGFVFVACTDHVQVLDAAHDGAVLGTIAGGQGVDNIDYVAAKGLLVITSGKASAATLVHVDDKGVPSVVATGVTAAGSRNGVADANGNIYVIDPVAGALLVLSM